MTRSRSVTTLPFRGVGWWRWRRWHVPLGLPACSRGLWAAAACRAPAPGAARVACHRRHPATPPPGSVVSAFHRAARPCCGLAAAPARGGRNTCSGFSASCRGVCRGLRNPGIPERCCVASALRWAGGSRASAVEVLRRPSAFPAGVFSDCDFNLGELRIRNSRGRVPSRAWPLNDDLGYRTGHASSRFTGSLRAVAMHCVGHKAMIFWGFLA